MSRVPTVLNNNRRLIGFAMYWLSAGGDGGLATDLA